ncbi:MAG TPA: DAK2 domain-containing protein, partial [Actinomycetota bacterium]
EHRHVIDRLNVFPVPDADTGTNLFLTLDGVVTGLESVPDEMFRIATAVEHGALMSARGISGVIAAQMLRTVAERVADLDEVDGPALAEALEAATEAAYRAVSQPVEGTILTVAREAGAAAAETAGDGASLRSVLEAARGAAWDAVERTPVLLPVLHDAGVVDGGGTGFALLFDALLHVVDGRPLPQPTERWTEPAPAAVPSPGDAAGVDRNDPGRLVSPRYEVALLLRAPAGSIGALREAWDRLGDSVVVAGGDDEWTCHVHTDRPEHAVEVAGAYGGVSNARVTDLVVQTVEERGDLLEEPEASRTAAVAVGAGEGVHRLFRSLGAGVVITPGSLDPSVQELLEAVGSMPAEEVVLVSDRRGVVTAAEQAAGMADRRVAVVPTDGIAQGLAALRAFDPDTSLEDNVASMRQAADALRSGRVARAVRDAGSRLGPIREGDWLALTSEGPAAVTHDLASAGRALLERLLTDRPEIVTVIEGEDASEEVTRELVEWLQAAHPDVGVQILQGGQPVDAYVIGVE